MIFTERTIRVTGGESQINSPIVLYKGDKNIKIRFKIVDCPYTYSKIVDNIIEVSEASYAQLAIKTPNNRLPIFSDIAETENGYVTFIITGEMIDEAKEVGKYSFQVRLLDDEQFSRITIPEVIDGIEVRDPIAIEGLSATNEVDVAVVDYAEITEAAPENAFDSEGNYVETVWQGGDIITTNKLNKIEDGIAGVNQKVASIGNVDLSNYVTKETGNANQIQFDDGQSFQDKLNAGVLKGEKGDQGIQGVQGPKGDTGERGLQGPAGADGLTTSIIVNSNTYNHVDGTITLPDYPTVPTKISAFTNDTNYATQTYVNNQIANASLGGGEVDLSGYVTKEVGNANQIQFADGQTFQDKLDTGILKGEKGDKGDTGEQGPQGIQGATGKQGIQGPKGDTGATPNITIGTVSTLGAGSNATASITGTAPNLTLNLGIPKGEKGDTGDSGSIDTSDFATKTEVNTNLSKKQDKLVSGTNIKTINGQSLLGSGDITITGGSTEVPGTETIETNALSLMTYGKAVNQQDPGRGNIVDNASCWATVNSVSVTEGQEYTLTMDGSWMWVFTYDDSDNCVSLLTSGSGNNPQTFTFTPDTSNIRFGCYDPNRALTYCTLTTTVTTGGSSIDTSNFATKADLAKKQNTLVSGTNIKTINGESILGSGNITISGGGGGTVITPSEGLNGMVSVLTFGADSSGTNDCTSAIQSALDHSNNTGQTIYFPPGRYKVLNTLYVGEYASMKGDNNSITGIGEHNGSGNKNNVVWITSSTKVFQGKSKSETELYSCKFCMEGMTLQCEQNQNNSVVFYKLLLNNANIRDCLIRSYGTVILGAMCYVTTITHNWFLDIRNYFFKSKNIEGLADQRPASMTDSYITDNYINGSVLSNNHTGFDIHFPNYSVIHNNFIDFWKIGMNISSGQGLAITNNTFQFCMRGIFLETASNISIMNNSFGLMNYNNNKANYVNAGTDISSWETTWCGIYISYQCTEINIHCNMGMTVDKLIRINGYGYKNFFIRDNTHWNVNNIVDIISMDATTGMENGGKNVFVQTITSI